MNKMFIILIILLLVGLNLNIFAAGEKEINSKIEEVVIYDNLAAITRSGSIVLKNGLNILIFKKLPIEIKDNTVRLKMDSDVKILEFKVKKQYLLESRQQIVRDLEKRIEGAQNKDRELADKLAIIKKSLEILASLDKVTDSKLDSNIKYGKINTQEWDSVLKFTEKNRLNKMKQIREIEAERKEISKKIAKLEKEIADIIGIQYIQMRNRINAQISANVMMETPQQSIYTPDFTKRDDIFKKHIKGDKEKWITITLEAPSAGKYNYKLEYNIPGAFWNPVYDIRAFPNDEKIEFTYFAMVNQKTGEDWTNVAMQLSTARPYQAVSPPTASPWRIRVYDPYTKGEKMYDNMMISGLEKKARSLEREKPKVARVKKEPVYEKKTTSIVFPIKIKKNIPSRDEKEKVTIDNFTVKGKDLKFEYFTIPANTEKVFLYTTLTNRQNYPMLKGSANVFVDTDFIGTASINDIQHNEVVKLFFGSDDTITVKKRIINEFREDKGKDIKISYHYRIELNNLKDKKINLLVKDPLPVSNDKNIKIKIESIIPLPISTKEEMDTYEYKNGIRKYRFKLNPKEKKEINIRFSIQHNKYSNLNF